MNTLKKFLLKTKILSIPFYLFRIFKIKNNKIVCISYHGKGYGDNPKYVIDSLKKINDNLEIVWLVNDKNDKSIPKDIKKVKINSLKSIYHLVTAKVWLTNSRVSFFYRKRKGQLYIDLWHGFLGMKKCEYDVYDKMTLFYKADMKYDNKMVDIMLSNSDWFNEIIRRSFRFEKKILKYGSPRNDILFNANKRIVKEKVYDYFNINQNKKLIIYAPTFRDNDNLDAYNIDLASLKEKLENLGQNKFAILVRMHPNVKNKEIYFEKHKDCIDASSYPDGQELIIASDLMISDYSSIIFDAFLINIPCFIYASDFEDYVKERGSRFKLDELPFVYFKNNNDMISYFSKNDINSLSKKYDDFKKDKGIIEDGNASKRTAQFINNYLKEGTL